MTQLAIPAWHRSFRAAALGGQMGAPQVLAGVLLGVAVAASSPGTAAAAEKAIWGPLKLPGGASAFPTYRDLGVDTLQLPLSWRAVAPIRPGNAANPADSAYRWPAEVDQAVSEGAANGIQVAFLVSESPAWANGNQSQAHAPSAGDFATFMTAASRRYPGVKRWMIWGEPNRDDRFLPNATDSPVGPRAYAPILDAAYGALKAQSRENIVIGGMTWTGGTVKPASFLQHMRLPDGRRPRLDWFGHNPFPFRFPNVREESIAGGWRDISDMDTFSDELRRAYGPAARFWLSEFTVLSDRGSAEFEHSVSRPAQAQWLSAAFSIADDLSSIAGLGWLNLTDASGAPDGSNYGLLTARGERKPAYEAFRLAPAVRFRPNVRLARRVRRRSFARRGQRVLVRPRYDGRILVTLRTRRGRRISRIARVGRAGRLRALRVRRGRLRRGRYTVTVTAPRGETVRRSLSVR